MDEDQRDLARQLFVQAAEALEDAHEAAIKGQTSKLSVRSARAEALALHRSAYDVMRLAESILIVAKQTRKRES